MDATSADTPAACRRCGRCCRLGGPALHAADLPLLRSGRLALADLVTLRRGEGVTDNVTGRVGPTPAELVKLCDAPEALAALYDKDRLTRADILAPGPLAELCAHHEAETDLTRLAAVCRAAAAGDEAAREAARAALRFDAAMRELLPARLGVAPETLPFHLGRPLAQALPALRAAAAPAALYKRRP
jgi:hypothetical protein